MSDLRDPRRLGPVQASIRWADDGAEIVLVTRSGETVIGQISHQTAGRLAREAVDIVTKHRK